jgi:two-component system chemotaxis response regulator CheY
MKTVLVVDDSPTVRQQVAQALGPAGYTVMEAGDGMDALAKLGASPEIALIISDINMPRMNGLEMLEKVKSDGNHPNLPVLMLTSEGQPAMIERARKFGAKGWIVKPFKPELLLAATRRLLPDGSPAPKVPRP